MKLNIDVIEDYSKDLIFFEDYIPLRLYPYINQSKRRDYLKKRGLYEKIEKIKSKKKKEMNKSSNPLEYLHQDFIRWVKKNPSFKELII